MDKKYINSYGIKTTAANYITQILFERKAKQFKEVLPFSYWKQDPWRKQYQLTIIKVNALLKTYREDAIIYALTHGKGKKIYSIHCPWLDDLIQQREHELELLEQSEKVEHQIVEIEPPQKPFAKNNIINKLKDL